MRNLHAFYPLIPWYVIGSIVFFDIVDYLRFRVRIVLGVVLFFGAAVVCSCPDSG